MWRPRFLAIVSLIRSVNIAARGARVSPATVLAHRRDDPDFDAQVLAAQDRAIELLHDVTFRDALEGTVEPIYWQGIRCGSVRKYDNRLRIEMLRAHMPRVFKTPGQHQTNVNIGGPGSVFGQSQNGNVVIDASARDELVALRQVPYPDYQGFTPFPYLGMGVVPMIRTILRGTRTACYPTICTYPHPLVSMRTCAHPLVSIIIGGWVVRWSGVAVARW
jgi:hypothetical protein